MAYTRRTVLKWGMLGLASTQVACINLSPFGTRTPATSSTPTLDYGKLKVYHNDEAVLYATPTFQLLFKNFNKGDFKLHQLPTSLLGKAFASIGHVRVGSVSDRGKTPYGNAQYILLTFRAADLTATEKRLLEQMGIRETAETGSVYTNPLINHGMVQPQQAVYNAFLSLSGDFNNVFFDVAYPAGFFDDALKREQVTGMVWELPLDAEAAKRQQAAFGKARTPIKIAADGTVSYKGKTMRNLAEQVTVVDVRTREHM